MFDGIGKPLLSVLDGLHIRESAIDFCVTVYASLSGGYVRTQMIMMQNFVFSKSLLVVFSKKSFFGNDFFR